MKNVLEYWIRAKDATGAVLKSALQKAKDFGTGVKKALSGVSKETGLERVKETVIHTEHALDLLGRGLDRVGVEGEEFRDCMDVMERAMDRLNKGSIKTAALFEITRKSLADVGLSAKQVEQGINLLKKSMVEDLAVSGKEASREMRRDFTGVRGVIDALNGNVHGLGRAFTWLLGHIKKLNLSAAMLSGIGIAVYAVTEAVSKCVSWWREKKKKLEEIKALRFENTLKNYEKAQSEVNNRVSDFCDELDLEIERKRKLIDQNERLKAQELERLRIAELSAAKTDQERENINRDYDAAQAQNKAEAAEARANLDIEAGGKMKDAIPRLIKPLEESIKGMEPAMKKLEEERDKILANAKERISKRTTGSGKYQVTQWGSFEYQRQLNAEEQKVALEEFMASDENYKKVNERYEKMKEQYDSSNRSLKEHLRKIQEGTDRIEDGRREAENVRAEHEIDVWRDQEEAMYSYYEEMARLEEESARQEQMNAEKKAKLDRDLHEQRMKAAEDELSWLNSLQSEAANRLTAAQSQVSKAWGFYRDKSKMQEAINDYNAQKKAEEQWAKDFEKLRSKRRDWRDIEFGQLSAEEEAVRQVALAKEEERAAQIALDSINEQTARAADAVEEIHKILSNGGEP
jgi:hypothetical protein